MDPVLISNQVYQAIQLETLEEPKTKSTILYANKYSGLGEIPISDSELLSVLNSTAGNAGNNVLVQLKQKMSAFRNGPWYIDSKDGAIYIHNRKYTSESVYNYTYNAENGELLMASFRMVEVNRGIEGLGGFVNAITKAVGMLNQKIEAIKLEEVSVNPFNNQELIADINRKGLWSDKMGKNTIVGPYGTLDLDKKPLISQGGLKNLTEPARKKRTYDARSPQEKVEAWKDKQAEHQQHIKNVDMSDVNKFMSNRSPLYRLAYEYYLDQVKIWGNDSPQAKAAKDRLEKEASKMVVPIQNYDPDWGYYSVKLTTAQIGVPPAMTEARRQKAIQDAISKWFNRWGKKFRASDFKWGNVKWKKVGFNNSMDPIKVGQTDWEQATFTLNYWGYAARRDYIRGDRLIKSFNPRYPDNSTNPASLISNAAANMGRRKREKRLQASIRTIGNPLLEVGMQIELQNVGQRQSGLWYIHQITHTIEHGQGYLCDAILSRQIPKAGTTGTASEIHTQAYTTDNEVASPSNNISRKSIPNSGKNNEKAKANVVKGNSEYTYNSAFEEPLSVEEYTYIVNRASTGRSKREIEKLAAEELHSRASVKMYNREKGTKLKYVTSKVVKGKVQIDKTKNIDYTTRNVKRTSVTSRNFDYVVKMANSRKKK